MNLDNVRWERVMFERYRLDAAEQWPDSPRRLATLAAIRSSMEDLMRDERSYSTSLVYPYCETGHPKRT